MFGTGVAAFNVAGVPTNTSAFVGAIDVAAFMPVDEFKARMDSFIEMMCSASPAAGFQRVMAPGQPEAATEALRRREGIPISASLLSALQAIAAKVNAKPLMAA
jgi:ureidoglycolate dehydrogenase (NAD+)